MEVILLEDVKSVGKKGDVVNLSDAYARNCIIKKKLGIEATAVNKNDLKLKNANDAKLAKEKLEEAKKLAEDLKEMSVTVKLKTGAGGKTFGSISSKEISVAVKEQLKLDLDKKKMILDEPIKSLGTHNIKVRIHPEVTAELAVKVVEG